MVRGNSFGSLSEIALHKSTSIIRKKPTIYDLSLLSGHSPSTVSAVISGTWRKRRIKEATAKAILDLAERHQYTANLQARGLRRSRSGLVGLMVPVHEQPLFLLNGADLRSPCA